MSENNVNLSPLEQMNKILSEKEAVIDAKLEDLKKYKQELQEFENQLTVKVNEVQKQQQEIAAEKEAIKNRWEEIKAYEKNLQKSMSEVLAEKVLIEQRSKQDLEKILDDGRLEDAGESSEFDLNALRASVGIDVPNFGTQEDIPKMNVSVEEPENKVEQTPVIPGVFLEMEKEITKSYPKWSKLELFPERYCLQYGDKEIRFFDTDPVPIVQIVVFRRNARTDKRLQNNIIGIERVAPDWSITVEDNQFVCTMQFTAETKPSVVLKKCNDFIKNHLI